MKEEGGGTFSTERETVKEYKLANREQP